MLEQLGPQPPFRLNLSVPWPWNPHQQKYSYGFSVHDWYENMSQCRLQHYSSQQTFGFCWTIRIHLCRRDRVSEGFEENAAVIAQARQQ